MVILLRVVEPLRQVRLSVPLQAAGDPRQRHGALLSTPGAKRLKGELPAGTLVAHKTGTGGTRNGITAATNDIGIITLPDGRHLAVAAFVSDSAANDDTRDAVIARLAKAAWDQVQSLGR